MGRHGRELEVSLVLSFPRREESVADQPSLQTQSISTSLFPRKAWVSTGQHSSIVAVDIDAVYKISAEDRIRASNIAYIFLFISIDSESEEEEEEKAGGEEAQRGWNYWRLWFTL